MYSRRYSLSPRFYQTWEALQRSNIIIASESHFSESIVSSGECINSSTTISISALSARVFQEDVAYSRHVFFPLIVPDLRFAYDILLRAPPRACTAADAVLRVSYSHDLCSAQVIAVGMLDVLEHAATAYLEALAAAPAVIYVAAHHKGWNPTFT